MAKAKSPAAGKRKLPDDALLPHVNGESSPPPANVKASGGKKLKKLGPAADQGDVPAQSTPESAPTSRSGRQVNDNGTVLYLCCLVLAIRVQTSPAAAAWQMSAALLVTAAMGMSSQCQWVLPLPYRGRLICICGMLSLPVPLYEPQSLPGAQNTAQESKGHHSGKRWLCNIYWRKSRAKTQQMLLLANRQPRASATRRAPLPSYVKVPALGWSSKRRPPQRMRTKHLRKPAAWQAHAVAGATASCLSPADSSGNSVFICHMTAATSSNNLQTLQVPDRQYMLPPRVTDCKMVVVPALGCSDFNQWWQCCACSLACRLLDVDIHDRKGTQQPLDSTDLAKQPLFITGMFTVNITAVQ